MTERRNNRTLTTNYNNEVRANLAGEYRRNGSVGPLEVAGRIGSDAKLGDFLTDLLGCSVTVRS